MSKSLKLGKIFGNLLVLSQAEGSKFDVKCLLCNTIKTVWGSALAPNKALRVTSCGQPGCKQSSKKRLKLTKKIGNFKILSRIDAEYFLVKCLSCTNDVKLTPHQIRFNSSCGCLIQEQKEERAIKYENKVINSWTIVEQTNELERRSFKWKIRCVCGKEFKRNLINILAETSKSCGCQKEYYRQESLKKNKNVKSI